MSESKRAVVLLSGGLDSSTLVFHMQDAGFEVTALALDYGQRHVREIASAELIAARAAVPLVQANFRTALFPIFALAKSSQVGLQMENVPTGHYASESMKITLVPNRNMLLLSVAGALAESIGARTIAYAAHAGDHQIYFDCRPPFIRAMHEAFHLASEHGIDLVDPFAEITKADIVRRGAELKVPFELTWSCYTGESTHCGECGTCCERAEAFAIAGVFDPTKYQNPDFWRTATT
jgi:7-cyano-7-deazaguanine synthase